MHISYVSCKLGIFALIYSYLEFRQIELFFYAGVIKRCNRTGITREELKHALSLAKENNSALYGKYDGPLSAYDILYIAACGGMKATSIFLSLLNCKPFQHRQNIDKLDIHMVLYFVDY